MGVALFSLFLACGGDDDGGGGGTPADGGGSTADASDDGGGGNDAGRFDASSDPPDAALVDAAGPDASTGPGLVTVTVEVVPYPLDSVTVFFLRADDSVIDVVSTDENGRAQAMFDEPGKVVLLLGFGMPELQLQLKGFLGVRPGTDIYHVGRPRVRSATLTFTGPIPDNAFQFGVETPCGLANSVTPSVTLLLEFCGDETPVFWLARTLVGGQVRRFSAFAPSVPVANGSFEVKGPLREDLVQTTRVTGLPEAQDASMFYVVYGEHGRVQEGFTQGELTPVDGSLTIFDPFHDLRDLGLRGRILTQVYRPGDNVTDFMAWVDHDGSPDVDLAPMSPAFLGRVVFHRDTATWTWTEESPGTVTAVLGAVAVSAPERPFFWHVLAANGTPVRVPRLPPPYEVFNVEPDSLVTSAGVDLIGHSRGYGPVVADVEGVIYGTGEVGDIITRTVGFDFIIE